MRNPVTRYLPLQGVWKLTIIVLFPWAVLSARNEPLEYGNITATKPVSAMSNNLNKDDLYENFASNLPSKGSDEIVYVIDLEHELELLENSERVDSLGNLLDNGPTGAKFIDIESASHHQTSPTDELLSPENLENIIKNEHEMSKSAAKYSRETTYHHVQEHELKDGSELHTHKAKYYKRLFKKRFSRKIRQSKSALIK